MRMKSYVQNFLEEYGYDLGYTDHVLPELEDIRMVMITGMPVWKYKGMSEREYYGGGK
tara:strand:+ start:345 stop:518 length:174 start_codon:yes stop_codon:yes gene_type:complete